MVQKIKDSLKERGIRGMKQDKQGMTAAMKTMKSRVTKRRD
jgi:hypothetical protein